MKIRSSSEYKGLIEYNYSLQNKYTNETKKSNRYFYISVFSIIGIILLLIALIYVSVLLSSLS